MKLSRSVMYAIHASVRLAESTDTKPVSCNRLAQDGAMPERFLLQILRGLTKQGILESMRGGRGGFVLGREPGQVSLLNLIEAVEGPMASGMPNGTSFPGESGALLGDLLHQIAQDTRRQLEAIKLTDLLSNGTIAGKDEQI